MNLTQSSSKCVSLRTWLSIILNTTLLLGLNPLLAQTSDATGQAPVGWHLAGSKPANYNTGVDKEEIRDGKPSAYLRSVTPNTEGFGTLMQSINASNYIGERVRLRAWVKSQEVNEWAGMWMRVDRGQAAVAFDNMENRAIKGTQPWRAYDVVLDVPEGSTGISFGVLLSGAGEVWMNHVVLEEVGKDTMVTGSTPNQRPPLSATPVNLDFTE